MAKLSLEGLGHRCFRHDPRHQRSNRLLQFRSGRRVLRIIEDFDVVRKALGRAGDILQAFGKPRGDDAGVLHIYFRQDQAERALGKIVERIFAPQLAQNGFGCVPQRRSDFRRTGQVGIRFQAMTIIESELRVFTARRNSMLSRS